MAGIDLDAYQQAVMLDTKISQIRTLSTLRLGKRIGRVTDSELEYIISGFNEIID